MENREINVKIDSLSVFAPLIAAQLTSAYYNAVLSHHMQGIQATEAEVIKAVNDCWGKLTVLITSTMSQRRPAEGDAT